MKTTLRKLTALILVLCTAFTLASCDSIDEYDINLKITCDDGTYHVFYHDTREMTITRAYDGEEHVYSFSDWQYSRYANTDKNRVWFDVDSGFHYCSGWLHTAPDGSQRSVSKTEPMVVKERGEYVYDISVYKTTTINSRIVKLFVTVE